MSNTGLTLHDVRVTHARLSNAYVCDAEGNIMGKVGGLSLRDGRIAAVEVIPSAHTGKTLKQITREQLN